MGLEIGRIDHDGLVLCSFRHSQALHHLDKDALVAPAFPAVIQGLRRTIFPRRITPPEAVAIDENDAAQNTPIIDTLAAMALGEIGLKTGHLLLRQPEQITHQSGSYPPV